MVSADIVVGCGCLGCWYGGLTLTGLWMYHCLAFKLVTLHSVVIPKTIASIHIRPKSFQSASAIEDSPL